jgi:hypothetical protein
MGSSLWLFCYIWEYINVSKTLQKSKFLETNYFEKPKILLTFGA